MKRKTKTIFDPRYKTLVEELVRIRHKRCLSQAALAKLWGVSNTYIARIELRERRLDVIEMIDLLRALGLYRSEILKVIEKLI
ncbi:MAG: helix-turn-helix transcriptional regulator [Rickettsiales bacterium]|jgi:predicted transcriptional regulator|nr:helix-turn-helix transcriptional regulator [Rickettsiales bacterium]